jgi:hypothetical protein
MRKPNFGRLAEQDMDDDNQLLMSEGAKTYLGLEERPGSSCASYLDQDDVAMPFANERAGTIKYKTNPQVALRVLKN